MRVRSLRRMGEVAIRGVCAVGFLGVMPVSHTHLWHTCRAELDYRALQCTTTIIAKKQNALLRRYALIHSATRLTIGELVMTGNYRKLLIKPSIDCSFYHFLFFVAKSVSLGPRTCAYPEQPSDNMTGVRTTLILLATSTQLFVIYK